MIRLLKRLTRRGPRASHLAITVYSREGCGCCETALNQLREAQRHHGFSIERIDVDTDPLLADRYGATVPVVAVNGKVRFRGKINPVLLDRLLTAEAREN